MDTILYCTGTCFMIEDAVGIRRVVIACGYVDLRKEIDRGGVYQMNKSIVDKHKNILLSDCVIKEIKYEKNDICLTFNEYGVWIRQDEKYKRKENVQIRYCDCDIDNMNIHITEKKKNIFTTVFLERTIDFKTFSNKINNGLWKCEIIQEYYCEIGSFFKAIVREENRRKRCTIEFEYKAISWE